MRYVCVRAHKQSTCRDDARRATQQRRLYGPLGAAQVAWADPRSDGLPQWVDRRVPCTNLSMSAKLSGSRKRRRRALLELIVCVVGTLGFFAFGVWLLVGLIEHGDLWAVGFGCCQSASRSWAPLSCSSSPAAVPFSCTDEANEKRSAPFVLALGITDGRPGVARGGRKVPARGLSIIAWGAATLMLYVFIRQWIQARGGAGSEKRGLTNASMTTPVAAVC